MNHPTQQKRGVDECQLTLQSIKPRLDAEVSYNRGMKTCMLYQRNKNRPLHQLNKNHPTEPKRGADETSFPKLSYISKGTFVSK